MALPPESPATPADINRNGRPTSIGTGGRHQSKCPAGIIGIRNLLRTRLQKSASDSVKRSNISRLVTG